MKTTEERLWAREFGRGYKVPFKLDMMVREGKLEDLSWHNDVCPSFALAGTVSEGESEVRLWVQHRDPAQREHDGPRYSVCTPKADYYVGDDLYHALEALKLGGPLPVRPKIVITDPQQLVGMRVVLRRAVERYPHFWVLEGAKGTVTEVTQDNDVGVKMDDLIDGAEEWDNHIWWSEMDVDVWHEDGDGMTAFCDDVRILQPAIVSGMPAEVHAEALAEIDEYEASK